jgi:hypothetical protein
MKKIKLIIILFFLLFIVSLFFVQVTRAGTEILYPTDDTYIDKGNENLNFGDSSFIQIRPEYWGGNMQGLIKFDVTSIPIGSKILSANLNLYYYQYIGENPQNRVINLHTMVNDWKEDTITWKTCGTNNPFYTGANVPTSFGWMTWDVKSNIQDFIDENKNNYGWKINEYIDWPWYKPASSVPRTIFYSKETIYETYIPYLEIEYAKLTMTSPKQGDTWYRGETHTIRWDTINAGNNVKIEYGIGSSYYTITPNTSNSGTYSWTIPSGLSPGSSYKIRVTGLSYNDVYDESSFFSIYEPSRYISVTSPKQGDTWYRGKTHTIQWQSAFAGNNVKIEYGIGSSYYTIASSASNSGTYSWTIPSGLFPGSSYKIRVTSLSYNDIYNESSFFSINEQFIQINSPHSTSTWYLGERNTITWNSANAGNFVKIELYRNSIYNSTIVSSTSNSETYSWTIPSGLSPGSSYKIRITSLTYSNVYDESSFFSINKPDRYITINSPKQGDTFYRGENYTIRWQSAFVGDNVKIEYGIGSSYYTIASSASNSGTYMWMIPSSLSLTASYKIRITSLTYSSVYDESGSFSIDQRYIKINRPHSTNIWYLGQKNTITWNSENIGNSVKIELYENNRHHSTIASSAPNNGKYTWMVPRDLSPSSSYRIRISSRLFSYVDAYSGGNLTIQETLLQKWQTAILALALIIIISFISLGLHIRGKKNRIKKHFEKKKNEIKDMIHELTSEKKITQIMTKGQLEDDEHIQQDNILGYFKDV